MVPDTEEQPEDVTDGLAEPVTDEEEDTLCEGDIVPDTVPVTLLLVLPLSVTLKEPVTDTLTEPVLDKDTLWLGLMVTDTVEQCEGEPDAEDEDDTDGDTVPVIEPLALDDSVPDADTLTDPEVVTDTV